MKKPHKMKLKDEDLWYSSLKSALELYLMPKNTMETQPNNSYFHMHIARDLMACNRVAPLFFQHERTISIDTVRNNRAEPKDPDQLPL